MKWIVQQYYSGGMRGYWNDIAPHGDLSSGNYWEASDAGQAFHMAVIANSAHKLQSTSYRVLPYSGGATFNVGVNVDAKEHDGDH